MTLNMTTSNTQSPSVAQLGMKDTEVLSDQTMNIKSLTAADEEKNLPK